MLEEHVFTTMLGDRPITLKTGKIARLAGGAVVAQSGDTVLLATATMAHTPREDTDFFPLTVDFEERLYAAGRIPGSFFRREGKPSEQATLTSRLIDRPLRPLFPKDMRNDVQIIVTSLSQGEEDYADILSVIAASAALMISDIPFEGPVGAVRIGYIEDALVVNPTISQMKNSTLDLRVAGSADAIIMVEAGANEIKEELMVEAMQLGQRSFQSVIQLQNEMRAAVGKPKSDYPSFKLPDALKIRVADMATERVRALLATTPLKGERIAAVDAMRDDIKAQLAAEAETEGWTAAQIAEAFEDVLKEIVRRRILDENIRPDGRDQRTIRPLDAEVHLVPRPHGSGLFTRGETQVLTLATLGMPNEEQEIDDLSPEETKRYIHHYNFPPYSTGEAYPLRGPRRREIGHGALAERALVPVIPPKDVFPYTIRVVSEVMASNGSTSMASTCGSTLALMDAGVPIKAPVGGIAMGLVSDGERYRVLTDIQGMEDHLGDMDFKVTGTRAGITALQMDIKIQGVTREILSEALAQAKQAREQIIDVIEATIPTPRKELSVYAPKMFTTTIDPDKIGALIGPGGKNIRALQADYAVKIDVEEDGTVFIAAAGGDSAQKALQHINAMMETPQEGKIYTGKVVRVAEFGAFVEILPGVDGMVHISQLSDTRVNQVTDVVNVGDEILAMITDIGPEGKIRLSRRAVLEGWTLEEAKAQDAPRGNSGGHHDNGRRESSSNSRGGRRR
ncbi:MAG TPA: polyribonucleotide nucleotidyltransferase [Anaerolineae bacterium]|nr:polyribonucleotide nucleotidyltransferase [Anaerolineae bacterium]HQH38480.1 polyribonucleotide nucleotidyltransferase [Anaerolineae bacterium]